MLSCNRGRIRRPQDHPPSEIGNCSHRADVIALCQDECRSRAGIPKQATSVRPLEWPQSQIEERCSWNGAGWKSGDNERGMDAYQALGVAVLTR